MQPRGCRGRRRPAGRRRSTTKPVSHGARSTLLLGDRVERRGELQRVVAEHELEFSSLPMPSIGWNVSCCMHAPTISSRAFLGRHPHRLLDHPGNTDRLEDDERLAAVDAAPRLDRRPRRLDRPPRRNRGARRAPGELGRSRPDDRSDAEHLIAAMHASPTGPRPITTAASPTAIFDLATAWTPTASGSVSAAMRCGRPVGTLIASISFSTISSA